MKSDENVSCASNTLKLALTVLSIVSTIIVLGFISSSASASFVGAFKHSQEVVVK